MIIKKDQLSFVSSTKHRSSYTKYTMELFEAALNWKKPFVHSSWTFVVHLLNIVYVCILIPKPLSAFNISQEKQYGLGDKSIVNDVATWQGHRQDGISLDRQTTASTHPTQVASLCEEISHSIKLVLPFQYPREKPGRSGQSGDVMIIYMCPFLMHFELNK